MDIIKKTIERALTTGRTESCTGNCYVIVPNENTFYEFKILLTKRQKDWGIFDIYPDITYDLPESELYDVTGVTVSRLSDLENYKNTNVFEDKYPTSSNVSRNGVDYNRSNYDGNNGNIFYYVDNIEYKDTYVNGVIINTQFTFKSLGYSSSDFINAPIVKNPDKYNIVSNPKINDNVFISRQTISAFNNNYKLNHITSLSDLTSYVGGRFFNIINNI